MFTSEAILSWIDPLPKKSTRSFATADAKPGSGENATSDQPTCDQPTCESGTPASVSDGRAEVDSPAELDFESAVEEIEQAVRDLEGGDLTLDQALGRYEKAVGRLRQCYSLLEVAERKISVLAGVDAEGHPITEPLDVAHVDESLTDKQASRGRRRTAEVRDE